MLLADDPETDLININEDDIEFGDVERGILGFGKMTMTPEDQAKIQAEARNKMTEKLEEQKSAEEAVCGKMILPPNNQIQTCQQLDSCW